MKKSCLIYILSLLSINIACAQSIVEGGNIINPNVKLGFFNVTENDKGHDSIGHGKISHIEYILQYERCIDKDFTVGGIFRYNAFILPKDTATNQINQAYGVDFCLDASFHFVKTQHVDIYLGATMGVSYLRLVNTNLNDQAIYDAAGAAYNLDIGARFYVNEHIGITLTAGYAGYDYPNGTEESIFGYVDHMGFVFDGATFGLGACYKF